MGGINGGKSNEYIKMIDTLASNIDDDYECGIVAIVHDESHINKYLSDHSCKVLKPQYCWPEEWGTVISPLIVFRDKSAFGKYFDISKGRKHPFLRKAKKFVRVMANAVRWYL